MSTGTSLSRSSTRLHLRAESITMLIQKRMHAAA